MLDSLPVGKLPIEILQKLLSQAISDDPRLILGPGIGLDCAVLDMGDQLLVLKSDPITFATDEIGWYGVQVNANDIATTGADPRWLLVTLLMPEGTTTVGSINRINQQVQSACREHGIIVIGGHTEVTYGIDRPILMGTMLGEVRREKLITPRGARPGDLILLTKGVPIEATAILAREFSAQMDGSFTHEEIQKAKDFLYNPGISILKDARTATKSGMVTAMHDPTEGGLLGALWELAEACGSSLLIETEKVYIPELSAKICHHFNLDPLACIASGALLLTSSEDSADAICSSLLNENIHCEVIGKVTDGPAAVWEHAGMRRKLINRPVRDELASLFENKE